MRISISFRVNIVWRVQPCTQQYVGVRSFVQIKCPFLFFRNVFARVLPATLVRHASVYIVFQQRTSRSSESSSAATA